MILVYAEDIARWGIEHNWTPLGFVATIAEAQALCAAYSVARLPGDFGDVWRLAWIELETNLSVERIREIITAYPETRRQGDDTTEAEATAQRAKEAEAAALQVRYQESKRTGMPFMVPLIKDVPA